MISILLLVTLINNAVPYVAFVLLWMPSKRTYFKSKVRKVTRQKTTVVCYNNYLIACYSYIITKEDRWITHNVTTKIWRFRMWLLCCCGHRLNVNNKFSQWGKKQKIIIVCYDNDLIAWNSHRITIEGR